LITTSARKKSNNHRGRDMQRKKKKTKSKKEKKKGHPSRRSLSHGKKIAERTKKIRGGRDRITSEGGIVSDQSDIAEQGRASKKKRQESKKIKKN